MNTERLTTVEFIRAVSTLTMSITDVTRTDTLTAVTVVLDVRQTHRLTDHNYTNTHTHRPADQTTVFVRL